MFKKRWWLKALQLSLQDFLVSLTLSSAADWASACLDVFHVRILHQQSNDRNENLVC